MTAQRELGPEYEDAVVESLVAKIEQRLEEHRQALEPKGDRPLQRQEFVLATLGIAIPLVAVAGFTAGFAGVVVVCIAIVLVSLLGAIR